jgi:hypothetical protein
MKPITLILNDDNQIADVDFVQWIMNEIEDKVFTRADVAQTYAILIKRGHRDWKPINEAIMKRWSPAALKWIKEQAWKKTNAA